MLIDWIPTPIGDGWDIEPDPIVWLDVAKVEASIRKDVDRYVGVDGAGAGQPSRYHFVGRLIRTGHPVYMPDLCLDENDEIIFSDGRHRFAWARDHGARAIPVTVSIEMAHRLEALYGASIRECRVRW